ncbi:hypothetical protein HYC85_031179 [Camellia sinensis]|uniref:Uncharacterized protein n=1 Tax=Camellia sinensis TaxID=4442 RepID=A0A7J7FTF6_CAMSI|nr:hypothetical protein HYC85_031179 [Camellia sinensis]
MNSTTQFSELEFSPIQKSDDHVFDPIFFEMRLWFTNIAYKLFDKMSKKNNYAHTNTYEDIYMYYFFAGQLFAKSFDSDKLLKKIG